MNSEEIKIPKLNYKMKVSWGKALAGFVFSVFLGLPGIVYFLNLIHPEWGDGLEKIIKQAFSSKDFLICILLFIIIFLIWLLIRNYKISSEIIGLHEQKSERRRSEYEQLEKQLDKSRSDYKQLQLQKPIIINTLNTYSINTPGKPRDPKKSVYSRPTPDKPSGETKNYTGHATPIDSDKIEILDIANDTAHPHNEDQE